jgi:hemin uptake protein HemP
MNTAQAHTAPHFAPASRPEHQAAHQTNRMDSADLLRGQKAVEIKHNGAVYRLQTTKLGKLILTK